MDDGGDDGGGSFKVKHGLDAADVTDVHEVGEVGRGLRKKDEDQK